MFTIVVNVLLWIGLLVLVAVLLDAATLGWLGRRIDGFAQRTEQALGLRDPGGNWIPKHLRWK